MINYNLTERELDTLKLCYLGKKEIAHLLCLSPTTIASHLVSIYSKLHVHNKTQALIKALIFGILDLNDIKISYKENILNDYSRRLTNEK